MALSPLLATELSLLVGIAGIVAGAVYYRLSNLESRRDREEYLNSKFDGRNWTEDPYRIEFDAIEVEESEGTKYWFEKYVRGNFRGNTILSVHTNIMFSDEFWNTPELFNAYHAITESDVKLLHKELISPNRHRLLLQIDSANHKKVSNAVIVLIGFVLKGSEMEGGFQMEPVWGIN